MHPTSSSDKVDVACSSSSSSTADYFGELTYASVIYATKEEEEEEVVDSKVIAPSLKAGLPNLGSDAASEIARKVNLLSQQSAFTRNEDRKRKQSDAKIINLKKKAQEYLQTSTTCSDFQQQQQKNASLDERIKAMLTSRKCDKVIVHIDMDAFYASAEELRDPTLRGVPMAVGSLSMLSTSNYLARTFGVRAGMPGYIAKHLCPDLVIVPLRFELYVKLSNNVADVLRKYAQRPDTFRMWGLDEAYLDITSYLHAHNIKHEDAGAVVNGIRNEVLQKVGLTASAGVACCRMLAKICSDVKKPNGQFVLPAQPKLIMGYMANLPVRRIPGVGKVTERILQESFNVKTCKDIIQQRHILQHTLSPKLFDFLLHSALGLGLDNLLTSAFSGDKEEKEEEKEVEDVEEGVQKSLSCERTIGRTEDIGEMFEVLEELAGALGDQLASARLRAHGIGVKLKTTDFRVRQAACPTLAAATRDPAVIAEKARKQLLRLIKSIPNSVWCNSQVLLLQEPPVAARLLGIKVSALTREEKVAPSVVPRPLELLQRGAARPPPPSQKSLCPVCWKTELHVNDQRAANAHIDACLQTNKEKGSSSILTYFTSHQPPPQPPPPNNNNNS